MSNFSRVSDPSFSLKVFFNPDTPDYDHRVSISFCKTPHRSPQEPKSGSSSPESRFQCNLSRARSTVLELARCNSWDYFVTFTVDPQKHDRYDFESVSKYLRGYFHRVKTLSSDFRYLLVPEQHNDGAWHFHGLVSGFPGLVDSHDFFGSNSVPLNILSAWRQGISVYISPDLTDKLGFNSFVCTYGDPDNTAKYMVKYLSKGLLCTSEELSSGSHLYFASLGLNRARVLKYSYIDFSSFSSKPFENDYVMTLDTSVSELRSLGYL